MSVVDDKSQDPPSDAGDAVGPSPVHEESRSIESNVLPPGDPGSYAAAPPVKEDYVPEDLRISWSWIHLLVFVVFFFAMQFAILTAIIGYYSVYHHVPQKQLGRLLESDPKLLAGTTAVSFGLLLLFLYVTLSVVHGRPFWRTLGWKKLNADPLAGKGKPWMYFLSGCGLSLFVALAESQVKNAEHAPILEFFKSRSGAILLIAMAVLVAPLAEETIFRGYLYPVFARIISAIARHFGMECSQSIRTGMASSILVTGILFGLMHGPQLGENWELVSLLILVGVIFTFARAWTGTVLASFLLHLGYNSMIAISAIITTKGFTQMPPH